MFSFATSLVAVIAATGISTAAPIDSTPAPLTAAVDYYQGLLIFQGDYLTSTSGSCGTKVAGGNMTASACNNFKTYGIGIHQKADRSCKLKLWKDVTTCDGDGQWIEIVIPKGKETTCIRTGVLDGGRFYRASGVYSCFE
ncbi:hypothetical protein C1H76_9714 [Elsinoe australis]|uniref:Uncharacterized protein n=1 Tax=Elsinoe australis TaxID=40998 RepID=A0A4U7AP33_9PEZI|nr:hypothetical protein C1H76_9714 [Elsinoe australis]